MFSGRNWKERNRIIPGNWIEPGEEGIGFRFSLNERLSSKMGGVPCRQLEAEDTPAEDHFRSKRMNSTDRNRGILVLLFIVLMIVIIVSFYHPGEAWAIFIRYLALVLIGCDLAYFAYMEKEEEKGKGNDKSNDENIGMSRDKINYTEKIEDSDVTADDGTTYHVHRVTRESSNGAADGSPARDNTDDGFPGFSPDGTCDFPGKWKNEMPDPNDPDSIREFINKVRTRVRSESENIPQGAESVTPDPAEAKRMKDIFESIMEGNDPWKSMDSLFGEDRGEVSGRMVVTEDSEEFRHLEELAKRAGADSPVGMNFFKSRSRGSSWGTGENPSSWVKTSEGVLCPTCNSKTGYIERHRGSYCEKCGKYVSEMKPSPGKTNGENGKGKKTGEDGKRRESEKDGRGSEPIEGEAGREPIKDEAESESVEDEVREAQFGM